MDKLGKVINGLDCCINHGKETPRLGTFVCDFKNCTYEHYAGTSCYRILIKDALELLKSQVPRVMTLDELSALPLDIPVFIEESNGECGWNVFYGIDGENEVCFCGFKASADYYRLEEYGDSWRCWTARPTDEQREATK